jgi:peptidyl-prolyl cis-trans isomerase SurA
MVVLCAGALPAAAESARQLDRVVALVDEDVVLESELLERVRMIRAQLQAAGREVPE